MRVDRSFGTVQALADLIDDLDPDADLVQRHLWLIALLQWVRGDSSSAAAAAARLEYFLDELDVRARARVRFQVWWRKLLETVDGSILLSDYGFATRNAFVSEFIERLHTKLLPATPQTHDASELFSLVMHHPKDSAWIGELSDTTLSRLARLLGLSLVAVDPGSSAGREPVGSRLHSVWQCMLLDAITYCTSQIRATGFSAEFRLRMTPVVRASNPFFALAADVDALRGAFATASGERNIVLAGSEDTSGRAPLAQCVVQFRAQLDACRLAADSVYSHLDAHGISMDLVFRLRQLRERVQRIRSLLNCLLDDPAHSQTARLLGQLAALGPAQHSLRSLVSASSSLLAAKVAQRSSETGERYITRNRQEHRSMLRHAAGGGAVTGFTTLFKFMLMGLGLSAFWFGFWSGAMYAGCFVVIQLLHFTLATKQPAMTAPAMAAKLKDINNEDGRALTAFVDEVTHLVRSQVAAVLGNVVVVFPVVLLLSALWQFLRGVPMIDSSQASYVFKSLALAGPSLVFAAFTGVLLFASSILAGWVENWFVLHRLGSALRYNPRITQWLGHQRAERWALFMARNVSGLASNISLGFMLGLLPAIMGFLSLGLDVRHVTLSTGQLGAACASMGWDVLGKSELWWALASIPFIGALNLGVSFYLAFRVALKAHGVTGLGRVRIRGAIFQRLRHAPLSFLWPTRPNSPRDCAPSEPPGGATLPLPRSSD